MYGQSTSVYLEGGVQQASVYQLQHLRAGHRLSGPAIVLDQLSTVFVEPGTQCVLLLSLYSTLSVHFSYIGIS